MTTSSLSRTVWKVCLDAPVKTVGLPVGALVLTVATQDGQPCLWVEVDATAPAEQRTFTGYGTGHLVPPGELYLGTAHDVEGMGLVFHVYERVHTYVHRGDVDI